MDMITAQGPLSVGAHKPLPELAGIGHNSPPDPFEAFDLHVTDLFEQAEQFLDGTGIATQQQADDVSRILNMCRKARTDADKVRADEKRPHDEAGKAVQAKWKPILDKCDLAAGAAKKVLAPWLEARDAEQRAVAEAARVEAEEKAAAARIAAQTVAPDDLAAQARLAELREVSEAAQKAATKAGKAKARASGGERAVGLRKRWIPTITDRMAVLKHYMLERPDDLAAWLADQVERDNRVAKRDVPGVTYKEESYAQ